MRCLRRTIVILAILGLAACGPVPQPFRAAPGDKAGNPLLAIPDGVGVTVAPISGAPPALAGPLTDALAEALRRAGVPASSGAALANSLLMEGEGRWEAGRAIVDWRLTDEVGAQVAVLTGEAVSSRSAFETGDSDLIRRLAERSALLTAAALAPDAGAAAASDMRGGRGVAVVGVEGAPGDGDRALSQAMAAVLDQAGIPMAEGSEPAALLLAGSVAVAKAGEDQQEVTIRWWLMDADGTVLGTLEQANIVPAGALDGRWGGAAYDAALANVEAIQEILERLDEIRALQTESAPSG